MQLPLILGLARAGGGIGARSPTVPTRLGSAGEELHDDETSLDDSAVGACVARQCLRAESPSGGTGGGTPVRPAGLRAAGPVRGRRDHARARRSPGRGVVPDEAAPRFEAPSTMRTSSETSPHPRCNRCCLRRSTRRSRPTRTETWTLRHGRRFPIVLFSHGALSFRLQSTFLTTHLASWGFVVASPDFLERGLQTFLGQPPAVPKTSVQVLSETVALLEAEDLRPGGVLQERLDDDIVLPIGHSAGGGASSQFVVADPTIPAWSALAAGATGPTGPGSAGLWMAGRERPDRTPRRHPLGVRRRARAKAARGDPWRRPQQRLQRHL